MLHDYIWQNLNTYVNTYGYCLLDNLMCIQTETATTPADRYQLPEDYYKHFDLLANSAVKFQGLYPFIGVYIDEIPSSGCHTDIDWL
jgi:hypothetical protein